MTQWDPGAPEALGLDWFPTEVGARILNASHKAAAFKFRSTATENVDPVYLWLPTELMKQVKQGAWLLEIYEEGNEIPGAVTTATYRPNAVDTNVNNSWVNQSGAALATANVVAAISETDLDTTTYTQYRGTYASKDGLFLEFNTNSASGSPAGAGVWGSNRRVVGGRLRITASRAEATGRLQVYFRGSDGGNYAMGEITVDTELREFVIPFPEFAPNGGVWTEAAIAQLDSLASIRFKPIGIGKNKPLRVYQVALEIDYVTENRDALGFSYSLAPGAGPWVGFDVASDPTQSEVVIPLIWEKAADTTYTFVLRRVPRWRNLGSSTDLDSSVLEGGSVGWGFLTEGAAAPAAMARDPWLPDPFMASYTPTLNQDGTIAEMGEPGTRAYGVTLSLGGGAASDDGQPYGAIVGLNPHEDGASVGGVGQTITAGATDEHSRLRFLVAPGRTEDEGVTYLSDFDPTALADLAIKVKNESTDAQVGSTFTLAAVDLDNHVEVPLTHATLPDRAFFVEVELEGINLVSATQYYVEFTSTQPKTDTTHWLILSGVGDTTNLVADDATFGGGANATVSTDGSTITFVVGWADSFLTLSQVPDSPDDFAVIIDEQPLVIDTQPNTPPWIVRDLEFAFISWSPTSLGGDFVSYEIQRLDAGAVEWQTIFRITDEAVDEAYDYEGQRNTEASYRMRVWASWHIASDWTATEEVTPEMADCALLFVSNEDPSINQGYADVGGERAWEFLTADERTTHTLVGRSYQVVTGPLEYRGDRFEVQLALWAGSVPAANGRAHFDHIERLNDVATSYIAVLDETGRRWYADVSVTDGIRRRPNVHEASVQVIELTDVPSVVDVAS